MRTLLLDLRYCMRSLGKAKMFTLVVAGTLAAGIASNLIVFSVVNTVLIRPLPYPEADRLVVVHTRDHLGRITFDLSASAFFMLSDRGSFFKDIAVISPLQAGVNLSGAGEARYVTALRVSRSYFATLGAAPALGRGFRADEEQPGAARAVMLSHSLWLRGLGGRPEILGQTLRINGEPCVVVGIMPPWFRSYPQADLWIPLQLSSTSAAPGHDYRIIARLRDNVDLQQADKALQAFSEPYRQVFAPGTRAEDMVFFAEDFHDFLVGRARKGLSLLLATVAFVLLITCTNLALLLIVRAMARSREVAIRVALGSSRRRIVGLFMIEGVFLALLGGIAGVILARELLPSALALLSVDLSLYTAVQMDWRVFLFAVCILALIALFFGCAPALKLSWADLSEKLRSTSITAGNNRQQARIGRLLVSLQTALTLILLAGAVLIFHNFINLRAVPPGFDANQVETLQVSLAANAYQTAFPTWRLLDKILKQARSLPDVSAAASVNNLPLDRGLNFPVQPVDQPENVVQVVQYRVISTDYFATLRIRLLAGRDFSQSDNFSALPVVIINETMARQWWPGNSAIGRYLEAGKELGPQLADVPRRVIGVVADIHEAGLDRPASPTIFVPAAQAPDNIVAFSNRLFLTSILVRTSKPAELPPAMSGVLAAADPSLPIASFRPLTQVVQNSIARPRLYALITSAFGVFALLLTAIGLYGLLSYQVDQRIHEIGVRMALGARRASVAAMILTQGLKLVSAGTIPGLIGAFFLKGLLDNMLYNLRADVFGFLIVAAFLMAVVAVMVGLITAVGAASIEPMAALRNE